jgi:RNA polymerase primary sigma factor
MNFKTDIAMKKNQNTTNTIIESIDFYEAHVKKTQLLTKEEEKTLGQSIRQGDIQARNKLVDANLRFVLKCAEEFRTYGVPRDVLISAGNAALIASADRFDPAYGTRFITYAVRNIKQSMFNAINEYIQMVHIPTSRVKEINFHYPSLDVFHDSHKDDDDDYPCLQNKLPAEPTTIQTEMLMEEECENLRHLLSLHFSPTEVSFLMDYAQACADGYDIDTLASKYHLPLKLAKKRLKSLLEKIDSLHLHAAYIRQAA